jgi:hypothetical protein
MATKPLIPCQARRRQAHGEHDAVAHGMGGALDGMLDPAITFAGEFPVPPPWVRTSSGIASEGSAALESTVYMTVRWRNH